MDSLSGEIIIISGHPGSGKTTIASALAHMPHGKRVHLHTDDFWGNIKSGLIDPWLSEAQAQNTMISQLAALSAAHYARENYAVFVDGVIRPWWLDAFRATALPIHYLVLRTSADEAVTRCLRRGADSLSDPKIVSALHAEFSDLGAYEPHTLSVSGLNPSATIARVSEALASNAYRLP